MDKEVKINFKIPNKMIDILDEKSIQELEKFYRLKIRIHKKTGFKHIKIYANQT